MKRRAAEAEEKVPIDPAVQRRIDRMLDRDVDRLPGLPWRRRLLIVGLAIAMGWAVVTTMVDPPGGVRRNPPQRADAAACAPGQTQGCVGGMAQVIVPAGPAASR